MLPPQLLLFDFTAGVAVETGTATAEWNPRTTSARILHPAGSNARTLHPAGKSASEWNTRVDRTMNPAGCRASRLAETTRVITEDGDFVITEDGKYEITE